MPAWTTRPVPVFPFHCQASLAGPRSPRKRTRRTPPSGPSTTASTRAVRVRRHRDAETPAAARLHPHRRLGEAQVAERLVHAEGPLHLGTPPALLVGGLHLPPPAPFRHARVRDHAPDPARPDHVLPAPRDRSVRPQEPERDVGPAHELRGERLPVADAVAVRREDRAARPRRVDPVVVEEEPVRHAPRRSVGGVFSTRPSKASVDEPPPSSAIAVTAPRSAMTRASARRQAVAPAAAAVGDDEEQAAVRQLADGRAGMAPYVWPEENPCPACRTTLPFRTRVGPPPMASSVPGGSSATCRRTVIAVPTGPLAWRSARLSPRAWRTAPPAGIGVRPPRSTAATVPVRSASSLAAGSPPARARAHASPRRRLSPGPREEPDLATGPRPAG